MASTADKAGRPDAEPRADSEADADVDMVRHVPACLTVGMRDGGPRGLPGCALDGRLPAVRGPDGGISRGAALILADQALARGVWGMLGDVQAMMTLDLRIDWHGALPAADALGFGTTRTVREGALCFVEGVLVADGTDVGSAAARFLTGAMPGGRTTERPTEPLDLGPSAAADFDELMGFEADGAAWRVRPTPALIGARAVPAYHGGFVAAALEAACARLANGPRAVNFEVRYLRPARADLDMRVTAAAVRAGQLASVLEADAWQGTTRVATARALFSGVPAEPGQVHIFD